MNDLQRRRLKQQGFPDSAVADAEMFGSPVAALYEYIDRPGGVITPKGAGTLLSALSSGCRVLLMRERTMLQPDSKHPQPISRNFSVDEVKPA